MSSALTVVVIVGVRAGVEAVDVDEMEREEVVVDVTVAVEAEKVVADEAVVAGVVGEEGST
jgi:hypothetical protein